METRVRPPSDSGPDAKRKANARNGLLAIIVGIFLAVASFVAHQAWSTDFFTSSFGLCQSCNPSLY